MSEKTLMALAVAAELTGTELSKHAFLAMEADLATYPEAQVLIALERCRRELKGRLTLSEVLDRLNDADGRPGADEAWAQSIRAEDEADTVVWTDDMRQAFSMARPLLELGDKVGARMAFRDAYERIVAEARQLGSPVRWEASLGWDTERRRDVLTKAVTSGLLPASHAAGLLPPPNEPGVIEAALFSGKALPRLVSVDGQVTDEDVATRERAMRRLSELRKILGKKSA